MKKTISFLFALAVIIGIAAIAFLTTYNYDQISMMGEENRPFPNLTEKEVSDLKFCSSDPDCVCCDMVVDIETEETIGRDSCINKDNEGIECVQLDFMDAYCAKNGCKCQGNRCVSVSGE